MYYNYDSSDDEWPEVRYRRQAAKKKSYPTNQDIFDRAEEGLNYTKGLQQLNSTSNFTDKLYTNRQWVEAKPQTFNSNIETDYIDTSVTRFVSNKTPFTYSAARSQLFGDAQRPNYITPASRPLCTGSIQGDPKQHVPEVIKNKEGFTDGSSHMTQTKSPMDGGSVITVCNSSHGMGDFGIIMEAVTSPLFLLILLLVILTYIVEMVKTLREITYIMHGQKISINQM